MLNSLNLPVSEVVGVEKHSGKQLKVIFLGENQDTIYMEYMMFKEIISRKRLGNVNLWKASKRLRQLEKKTDIVIVSVDRFFSDLFSKQGFTIIPSWIISTFDVSKSMKQIMDSLDRSLRRGIEAIEKAGLRYKTRRDEKSLRLFYYHIYLPYTLTRHGKTALKLPFGYLKTLLERGFIMFVYDEKGDLVSGALYSIRGKTIRFECMGVAKDKEDYLKKGAGLALYYFPLIWAKRKGYKTLDFRHSRSFFSDGSFWFKRKWRPTIRVSDVLTTVFAIKFCSINDGVLHFLIHNPFIYLDKGKLKACIFVDNTKSFLDGKTFTHIVRTYILPGVEEIEILSFNNLRQKIRLSISKSVRHGIFSDLKQIWMASRETYPKRI